MRLQLVSKQKGMVVETVLMVLSAGLMAIPSYINYENKAKVYEGLSLASSGKVAFIEYYVSNNYQLPQGSTAQEIHKQLGLVDPQQISTSSVESVSVSSDGSILVQYRPEVFKDSAIVLKPSLGSGSIPWTCSAQSEDKRFLAALPVECRN